MSDRGRHSLTAEAIEGPYKQQVEISTGGITEKQCELPAVIRPFATALMLDIFADNDMAHSLAPRSELAQLVFRVLALIVRRHSGVDGNPRRSHETFLLWPSLTPSEPASVSIG